MSPPQAISSAGRPLSVGAIALMLMLCLTWGFNQIAVKLVLPDVPPMLQAMIRSMGALPVLFIVFGLGELSKVVLIIIGVTPTLVRDLSLEVQNMPREQLIKAQTLGASTWQVAIRVVLPQIMPRLIQGLRLMIGPAFLFLISAEAIASDVGLGYRIFLVRRYLSMDVILPYVVWITLLAYIFDYALIWFGQRAFPWAYAGASR